ncbi:hypothetical protein GRJ2_003312000 [Grus japonensis]|uniref:RNase H type-1 domain-containing protein n=1 Tax=Grus japonensis TaxID=30415 RepID=A0ABC9YEG9_GRUJA
MQLMLRGVSGLITQWARIGNPNRPGILEVITDWPEGKDFRMSPEEEVTCAEEAPPYNKLTEDEKPYALFTDGSCRIVGKHRRWKAAVWSPTRQVAEAAEGEGESSQFAEVKAIQLATIAICCINGRHGSTGESPAEGYEDD